MDNYRRLGVILLFVSVGAIPAGLSMIIDPSGKRLGMDTEWFEGSVFSDFLIPGIFLFTVNGMGQLIAAIYAFKKHEYSAYMGMGFGFILISWILIQMTIVGFSIIAHPLYFMFGLAEFGLGYRIYGSS